MMIGDNDDDDDYDDDEGKNRMLQPLANTHLSHHKVYFNHMSL